MKYRKLTDTNDYRFGTFNQFHEDTAEGVVQAVRTRLLLHTGEWFLNTDEGTDYKGSVQGFGTAGVRDLMMQERILQTAGVSGITDYSSSLDPRTRSWSMNCTITTIYGPAELALEL